jgi:hypothetical protein
VLATGCSDGPVKVTIPNPTGAIQQQCAHLGDRLPATLDKLRDRRTSPRSTLVHAWGSPAVTLTCGVAKPHGYFADSASTTAVNDVEWFQAIESQDVVWTAIRENQSGPGQIFIALTVPKKYAAADAYLVELSGPIKGALPGAPPAD